jgi:hypothetical protein
VKQPDVKTVHMLKDAAHERGHAMLLLKVCIACKVAVMSGEACSSACI